jgi:beta-lactam-binding protein with PASTA domain
VAGPPARVVASPTMAMRDLFGSAVVAAIVAAGTTYALNRSVFSHEAAEVPSVVGLPVQSARALIENRGFQFVVGEEREDAKTPAGNVIGQKPLMGSRIERGQSVEVVVAKLPALLKMPALTGLALADAKARIERGKLVVGKVTEESSDKVKPGLVMAQNPAEGSEARAGSAVELVVSKGVGAIPVPSVLHRYLNKAKEELVKAGFTVGTIRWRADDDRSDGVILDQNPAPNQPAPKGSAVDLVVNRQDY